MTTADVVIIGGGVVGASVAYHLAEAGCADVVIVEREPQQGQGSTGRATGGVRAQFSTAVNIQMSLYSIAFLANFKEATGHASGYEPTGYLFVATSDEHLEYLKLARERQRAQGLSNVELIGAEDVRSMVPQMRAGDVVGGSFCATDGFVSPLGIMRGFTERARARGVRLWLDTRVTGIAVERGRVSKVETTRGEISTRAVVNASGAWAAEVARMAGVGIPVVPLRRQIVATRHLDATFERLPMVIDMSDGFHFRPDRRTDAAAQGLLLAWPDPAESPGFKTELDESFVEKIRARATARVPRLAGATIDRERSRAGLYEVTPDHHAIIGEAPRVGGLFLANGFSGHGVMHAPATGRVLSELILEGRARTLDVTSLRPARFAEGRLIEETSVL
ncbi:MAG TPA: FAD-binding oxidoreductase [Pyrinomonadaceae bacterium]|jgi:sarcosine oxidase subunit beta|nr:FAD-binding oxidoreductase [Pyrinomonadaceae bacterium]